MIEEWNDIIEFENCYQVNTLGDVKSLPRFVNAKNNSQRMIKEKILKKSLSNCGYYHIIIRKPNNNKCCLKLIHRLVAKAFIPNPNNLPEVNHKNGIKTDNRVENLEWCTSSQNQIHAIKNKLYETAHGENHCCAKLTEKEVAEIRNKYIPRIYSTRMLAKEYGVNKQTIQSIISNKTWKMMKS